MQPQMFSSELQFISSTAKLFHLERFAIYGIVADFCQSQSQLICSGQAKNVN